MADFGEGKWVVGRKVHRCAVCGSVIPKGEQHYNYRGMWESEWQNWRAHRECHAALDADDYFTDGFMIGDVPTPARIVALARAQEEPPTA